MKNYPIRFSFLLLLFASMCMAQIPIMAFHGVQPKFSTAYHFSVMKTAGINISFTFFHTNTEAQAALDAAEKSGVKILLYTDDLVRDTKGTIMRFRNHPALFGYYIADEPSKQQFSDLAKRIALIKSLDASHPCYINLFPNYADGNMLKTMSYQDYLESFVKTVSVDFISFDNYPLFNNNIHYNWYSNLEAVRAISLQAKKPFWGFANSTIFSVYKEPTVAGLKLQQYSNLLYGAQGLQYFAYWTLNDANWKAGNFGYSIVNDKGLPTKTYNLVKTVNTDIQYYAKVFMGGEVLATYHTGSEIPLSTKRWPNMPPCFSSFSTNNKQALISIIKNNSKNYIAILNKDIFTPLTLSYTTKNVVMVLNAKGQEIQLDNKPKVASVKPGDVIIFRY